MLKTKHFCTNCRKEICKRKRSDGSFMWIHRKTGFFQCYFNKVAQPSARL